MGRFLIAAVHIRRPFVGWAHTSRSNFNKNQDAFFSRSSHRIFAVSSSLQLHYTAVNQSPDEERIIRSRLSKVPVPVAVLTWPRTRCAAH